MSELTWTLKQSKSYEASWAVFKGAPEDVKNDMIQSYGLNAEELKDATTFEVAALAEQVMQGLGNVKETLGARVLNAGPDSAPAYYQTEVPQSEAKADPEPDPHASIHADISDASTKEALRAVWARNKEAFNDDSSLMDHVNERLKELG